MWRRGTPLPPARMAQLLCRHSIPMPCSQLDLSRTRSRFSMALHTFNRLFPRYSPSIFLMALQTLVMSLYCRKAYCGTPFNFFTSISWTAERRGIQSDRSCESRMNTPSWNLTGLKNGQTHKTTAGRIDGSLKPDSRSASQVREEIEYHVRLEEDY